eukprot:5623302-Pleurochrysis_carterae.AAC.1
MEEGQPKQGCVAWLTRRLRSLTPSTATTRSLTWRWPLAGESAAICTCEIASSQREIEFSKREVDAWVDGGANSIG